MDRHRAVPVRIEFPGILLLSRFRVSIDGVIIGGFSFIKGCDLVEDLTPGTHILSTNVWPYWPSWMTKKEFTFEIELNVQRKELRLSFSRMWGKFSELTVTNTTYSRKKTKKKNNKKILPSSATPSDTISKMRKQESSSEQKENNIELEVVPEVEETSMEKLEKLIKRRKNSEITAEEFEEMKLEILDRNPQISKEPVEIYQKEIQDDVHRKENRDSTADKSNGDSGSLSKTQELKELKEIFDSGFISKEEMEDMKKEILGK
jgi:hypothetical protein